jgi:hypothetical protein
MSIFDCRFISPFEGFGSKIEQSRDMVLTSADVASSHALATQVISAVALAYFSSENAHDLLHRVWLFRLLFF